MKIRDYIKATRETAVYPDVGNNVTYPALGLCGEAGEFDEEAARGRSYSLMDELGDLLWYWARVVDEVHDHRCSGIYGTFGEEVSYQAAELEDVDMKVDYDEALPFVVRGACSVAEQVKRVQRDHGGDVRVMAPVIWGECRALLASIAVFAASAALDLDKVAADNLEKLRSRKQRGNLHGSGGDR